MKNAFAKLFTQIRTINSRSLKTRVALSVVLLLIISAGLFAGLRNNTQPKQTAPQKPSQNQIKKKGATPKETTPAIVTPAPAAAPAAVKNYTYCVAVDGVDTSYLPEFSAKLASVYGDSRGWSLGGQVSFTKVESGCSLKVWLAAADRMANYGAICDSTWSCTVHPNVIINFDRWAGASDAWNSAGGSLDDYQTMVINHETGHWFGFQHKYCAGAGQPAPVMQQQSISLQGCTANSWPLATELAQLRASLGL